LPDSNPAVEDAPRAELSGEEDLWSYSREHLDFVTIKEQLAECATSDLGRKRCLDLGIETEHQKVNRRLRETSEMRSLMERSRVPLAGISDIRAVLQRAEKKALLSAEELWSVAECVEAGCKLAGYLDKHQEVAPTLLDLAEGIGDSEAIADQIRELDIEEGDVVNNLGGRPYYESLAEYDHLEAAAELDVPQLLVQGGRDYQVTVEDDLDRWEEALEGRDDVQSTVFDDLNHRFQAGEGDSVPSEYSEPGSPVAEELITEVIRFIEEGPDGAAE